MAEPLWNGVPFCGCLNAGASFLLIEVVIEFEIFFVNLIRPVFNTEDADGGFAVAEFDGIDETLMGIEVHGFPFVGILAAREVVEAAAQRMSVWGGVNGSGSAGSGRTLDPYKSAYSSSSRPASPAPSFGKAFTVQKPTIFLRRGRPSPPPQIWRGNGAEDRGRRQGF